MFASLWIETHDVLKELGLAVALQPACSWKLNNPKLVRNNCSSGVPVVPCVSSSLLPMDLQPQIKDCHCL